MRHGVVREITLHTKRDRAERDRAGTGEAAVLNKRDFTHGQQAIRNIQSDCAIAGERANDIDRRRRGRTERGEVNIERR